MATNFLMHEKIWFDKFKFDDAEKKFYEQMNGPAGGSSHQVGAWWTARSCFSLLASALLPTARHFSLFDYFYFVFVFLFWGHTW